MGQEAELTSNGNMLGKHRNKAGTEDYAFTLRGRGNGNKPIYEISASVLTQFSPNFKAVVSSISPSNLFSVYYRQTHRDEARDDGDGENLPALTTGEYHEFTVPSNGFPYPAHIRLIFDDQNRRWFITPTHYTTWHDGSTHRNPFYQLVK